MIFQSYFQVSHPSEILELHDGGRWGNDIACVRQ
jgi:hypothetical protein